MSEVLCGRVGCGEPAIAVLLMSPQDTQAWIVAPTHPAAPEGVPLCPIHADRITVPFGWTLVDDRPAPKKKRRRRKKAAPAAEPAPEPHVEQTAPDTPSPADEPPADEAAEEAPPAADAVESASPAESPAVVEAGSVAGSPAVVEPNAVADAVDSESPAVVESEPDAVAEADESEPVADDALVEPEAVQPADPAEDHETPEDDDPRPAVAAFDPDEDPSYVPPEDQFREDGPGLDEPTIQMPAVSATGTPAELPVDADRVAAAVEDEAPRLTVVPGDDDPDKTYDFADDGQGALWHEPPTPEPEPDERTPLLQRAFRVVRDDGGG